MAGMANWQAQISIDIDDLKKRIKVAEGELDKIEKKEHKVKLDIDTKTLENAISKLDRMLESLGKGSGDFKEFENLSKQLSSIATDINNISKAFSVMNDGSDFANIIKSIDASLTALSNHFISEMSGRMTSSIKEVKTSLLDIGDGGELTPLLETINKIENAIKELSVSVKGIGLNMNVNVGSDSEMESKIQSKISNALQAYQRLFEHIKMSSAGTASVNDQFFSFDINQYDTMMGKLQAYRKFIENMRNETKAQFNGRDVLYQNTNKSYWTQASAAMAQVTRAFNEMNASSDVNPLADMFGKTDLSGVISQLGLIVAKLEEISTTASSFKNVFANGFNVTSSVEEINKLTNRVKELEDELSKIKLNPVGVDKSNISSENITNITETFDKTNKEINATDQQIKKLSDDLKILFDELKKSPTEIQALLGKDGSISKITSGLSSRVKSEDIYRNILSTLRNQIFANIHNHPMGKIFSADDFSGIGNDTGAYENGNNVYGLLSGDNVKFVDFSGVDKQIASDFIKEYKKAEQEIKSQIDPNLLDEEWNTEFAKKQSEAFSNLLGRFNLSDIVKSFDISDTENIAKYLLSIESSASSAITPVQKLINLVEYGSEKKLNLSDVEIKEILDSFNSGNLSGIQAFDKLMVKIGSDFHNLATNDEISKLRQMAKDTFGDAPYQGKRGDIFLEYEDQIYDLGKTAEEVFSTIRKEHSELFENTSPIKDVFQGGKIDQATTSAKELDKTLEQVDIPTDSFDDVLSKLDLTKSKLKEIVKITKQSVSDSEGKFHDSYTLKDKRGSTEIYGLSSNTEKGQLLRSNIVGYDAKEIEQKAKAIKKLSDELEAYNKQVPKKPVDGQRSNYFEGFVQKYKNAINEAKKYLDNLGDSPVTEEVKRKWESLIDVIEQAKKEMDAVPNADRGSDALSRGKEIDTITKYLNKFTGISKQAKQELKGLIDQLQSGDPSTNVKKIHERFLELTASEREAGREAKSFFDIFKSKVVHRFASQLAMYYLSFYDFIRYTRNAITAVKELDTALIDLKKTTTMSASELERFYYSSNDVAKQMGVTTASIIEQASAWSRLGFSTKEQATQMAELSSQFASISPGMSTDDAQEGLVSIMKAWDISTDQVEREVMDNINVLGNKFAETNQDIVEGMKRSAATFAALGQTWTDSFAIFTGAQEVIQNAETVGKNISAYLYSDIMKIKVAISVKPQRWARPRKDYNICLNF